MVAGTFGDVCRAPMLMMRLGASRQQLIDMLLVKRFDVEKSGEKVWGAAFMWLF